MRFKVQQVWKTSYKGKDTTDTVLSGETVLLFKSGRCDDLQDRVNEYGLKEKPISIHICCVFVDVVETEDFLHKKLYIYICF